MTNQKGRDNDGDSDPFGFAQGRLLRVRMTGKKQMRGFFATLRVTNRNQAKEEADSLRE